MQSATDFDKSKTNPGRIYTPPRSGILSVIPTKLVPYGELIRINNPVGFIYLYTSCATGTLMVECLRASFSPLQQMAWTNFLLLVGSILFRSAACSWNDTIDREIDKKVSRTCLRPLARGAISPASAHTCTSIFLVAFLASQSLIPVMDGRLRTPFCALYSTPFILAAVAYPFLKRITYYPQVLLGFIQFWGIIIAFPALGENLFSSRIYLAAAGYNALSVIVWTMLNDTIYGFQDLEDDINSGIKSLAVRAKDHPKYLFTALATMNILFLALTGVSMKAGQSYYVGLWIVTTLLGIVIWNVKLTDPQSCGWWFRIGCHSVGLATVCCFLSEYASRMLMDAWWNGSKARSSG